MYYLNDDHEQYEYCLYTQVGNACPYITPLPCVRDLDGLFRKIDEIEKKHNRWSRRYYIDNEFYQNKYPLQTCTVYYKFLRRPVADWEEFEKVA